VPDCKKLRDPHLNVSAYPAEGELAKALAIVSNEEPVDRLDGLRKVLDDLRTCPGSSANGRSRTLDLIAHSDQTRLLHLGVSVIDPGEADVRRLFQDLATDRILSDLNIRELRLLGCETAMSSEAQSAIRDLTEILGIRVLGTTKLLYAANFGAKGLKDRFERMLCDAKTLPELIDDRVAWPQDPLPALAPPLELEGLQTYAVDELPAVTWPRLGLTDGARPLMDLINGRDGRVMPRLLARPRCELLLSTDDARVRRVQVLLNFELVRVCPANTNESAIYRVRKPMELEAFVESVGSA
jgi:hypothetical protein